MIYQEDSITMRQELNPYKGLTPLQPKTLRQPTTFSFLLNIELNSLGFFTIMSFIWICDMLYMLCESTRSKSIKELREAKWFVRNIPSLSKEKNKYEEKLSNIEMKEVIEELDCYKK